MTQSTNLLAGFAPEQVFADTKKYFPIATFDPIVEYQGGIILVKRTIAPYKDVWSLPGLRAFKEETLEQTFQRIIKSELDLDIEAVLDKWVGIYRREFTEAEDGEARVDIANCFVFKAKGTGT